MTSPSFTRHDGDGSSSTLTPEDTSSLQVHQGAAGSSGQVETNNGGALAGVTVSGDGTLNTATGALVVTKTNGVAFDPLATGWQPSSAAFTTTANGNGAFVTVPHGLSGTPSRQKIIVSVSLASGTNISQPIAIPVAVDATNITFLMSLNGINAAGTYYVNVLASV